MLAHHPVQVATRQVVTLAFAVGLLGFALFGRQLLLHPLQLLLKMPNHLAGVMVHLLHLLLHLHDLRVLALQLRRHSQ